MKRSFSSKPRLQRQRSLLRARSPKGVLRSNVSSSSSPIVQVSLLDLSLDGAAHHHFFDFSNGFGGVQILRTHVYAVHDGVAAEQAIGVFQIV